MIRNLKNDKSIFLISLALSFVYILPFIINNNYVVDDWLRTDTGVTAWEGNGRPLSSVIMAAISMFGGGLNFFGDGVLYDIFPLTIILCAFVMTFCGYLISAELGMKSPIAKAACMLLPLTSTLFIGNIYFRFDSLIMSLSCLGAILQARMSAERGIVIWISSVVIGFISISIYQASIPFVLSYLALMCFMRYCNENKKDVINLIIKVLSSLFFSFLIYKVMMLAFFDGDSYTSGYTDTHSQLIPISVDGLKIIVNNFSLFISMLYKVTAFAPCIILLTLLIVMLAISFIERNMKIAFSVFAFIAIIVLGFAPYLVLRSPIVEPRVMIAAGLSLCALLKGVELMSKLGALSKSLIVVFIAFNFSQAYGVSNAFNIYQRIDRVVAQNIAFNLIEYGYKTGDKLVISGFPSYPDSVKRIYSAIPVSQYLVGSAFANYRFKYSLMKQYGISSSIPKDERFNGDGVIMKDNNLIKLIKYDNGYRVYIKRM